MHRRKSIDSGRLSRKRRSNIEGCVSNTTLVFQTQPLRVKMADTSNTVGNGAVVSTPSRATQETTPTKTVGPGAGETSTSLGKTPTDSNQLVSVDGLTVLGAGSPQSPLRA